MKIQISSENDNIQESDDETTQVQISIDWIMLGIGIVGGFVIGYLIF